MAASTASREVDVTPAAGVRYFLIWFVLRHMLPSPDILGNVGATIVAASLRPSTVDC